MIFRLLLLQGLLFLFASAQTLDVASKTHLDEFTMAYFYDPTGQKELSDIKHATFEQCSNTFLFPQTQGTHWVYLSLYNSMEQDIQRTIAFSTNQSETAIFYEINSEGALRQKAAFKQRRPVDEKALYFVATAHTMTIAPHETIELYIRIESNKLIMFGKLLILDKHAFMRYESGQDRFYHFYFGVVFAMLVYNLFIYVYYRDRIYIFYNFYLIFLNIWFLNQIGFYAFVVPQAYELLPYYFIPLADLFLILFTKELLQNQIKTKLFKQWNRFYMVSFTLLPLAAMYEFELMITLILIMTSTFFLYALYIVFHGTRKTLPYSLAFGIYMITGLNVPLVAFGILPYSEITININIVGAMIESLMFSIILAHRITDLKQEKLAIQTEITMIKENQNQLLRDKVAEQTKELRLLFQELHHRVKNNLQFILTFLWVQKESLDDPVAITALQQATNRIQTISALHELLYQSGQTSIAFYRYLDLLLLNYKQESPNVFFVVNVDQYLKLDIDTTVSLGLILNELITNSIKHAFVQIVQPQITIQLHQSDKHCSLFYRDNGIGFDPEKVSMSRGFGFELIHEFVKKMPHAKREMDSKKAFQMRVDFDCENIDAKD